MILSLSLSLAMLTMLAFAITCYHLQPLHSPLGIKQFRVLHTGVEIYYSPINSAERIVFPLIALSGDKNISMGFPKGIFSPHTIYIKVKIYNFYVFPVWVKQNSTIHPQKTATEHKKIGTEYKLMTAYNEKIPAGYKLMIAYHKKMATGHEKMATGHKPMTVYHKPMITR
jgi:hypothetical protein